jgi:hypothetical protein
MSANLGWETPTSWESDAHLPVVGRMSDVLRHDHGVLRPLCRQQIVIRELSPIDEELQMWKRFLLRE